MIDDIVRKARRRRPDLADDLEQEARIAAWLAEKSGGNPGYVRLRAKMATVDFMRGKRHAPHVEFVEYDDHASTPFAEPTVVLKNADVTLLTQVVRHSSSHVAAALGVSRPTFSKRLRRARERVEAELAERLS